jgi:hypothetical protein
MKLVLVVVVCVVALAGVAGAFALSPGTKGQPNQSCQQQTTGPAGLISSSNGFATKAVTVYAGSLNTPSHANGSSKAVSQYDVACFEVSQ